MTKINASLRGQNLIEIFSSGKMVVAEAKDKATQVEMRVLAYGDKYKPAANWSMEVNEGAFTGSLAELNAGEDYAHCYGDGHEGNVTKILANTRNPSDRPGGMEFYEGDDGLYAKVTLPDTTAGRDISKLLKAGVIGNVSIGMFVDEMEYIEEAGEEDDETFYRGEISEARIVEVSFVHRGKFDSAQVMSVSEVQAQLDVGVMTCAAQPAEESVAGDTTVSYEQFSVEVRDALRRIEAGIGNQLEEFDILESSDILESGAILEEAEGLAQERLPVKNATDLLIGV